MSAIGIYGSHSIHGIDGIPGIYSIHGIKLLEVNIYAPRVEDLLVNTIWPIPQAAWILYY